ncbi:MAG TPA: CAP domain-containing protein [Amaricoccus sp.]|nr:CAP domain-containing protein [Amaricoccus sp.]
MRRVFGLLLVTLALSGPAPLAAQEPRVPPRLQQPVALDRPDQALFNEAVLIFSNEVRREHGRAPLRSDAALLRAASDHAGNMARLRTHSHILPVRGQRDLSQRMQRQSLQFRFAAENIAMDKVYRLLGRPISTSHDGCRFTYGDTREAVPVHTYASLAREVVGRWLASPKHRESLLSKTYQRLGAGVGVDRSGPACGDFYLVQDFAD